MRICCQLESLLSDTGCTSQPSEDGRKLEKCSSQEQRGDTKGISYPHQKKGNIPKGSSIVECPLENKKTTSKDKKTSSGLVLKGISKKSLTLLQGSTSKDQDSERFWKPQLREMYQRLSWHQGIDWQDTAQSSLNGCSSNTKQLSWFSMTTLKPQMSSDSQRTSWPSSKFTVADGMAKGAIPKLKALKLRLKPSKEQLRIIKGWASASRYTYNATIAVFNNPKDMLSNAMRLRNRFVTSKTRDGRENNWLRKRKWLKETPKEIRKGAVDDAVVARRAAITNLKNGNIKGFTLGFRSKKLEKERGFSLTIPKSAVKRTDDSLSIFPRFLGEMRYYGTKQMRKIIGEGAKHDCKLQMSRYGELFLIVPVKVGESRRAPTERICAIDPGMRKYLTVYDPSGEAKIICPEWKTKMMPLLLQVDKLVSEMTSLNGRRKRATEMKLLKVRKRIHYLKTELSHQASNYLTNHYDTILYPKLNASNDLVGTFSEQARTKLARALSNMRHCETHTMTSQKAKMKGVRFLEVDEQYTSQTCVICGALTKSASEMFRCHHCSFTCDRDIVGAGNVLLRSLSK